MNDVWNILMTIFTNWAAFLQKNVIVPSSASHTENVMVD
jgi:hypothetical protein